jgi:hypothetical protein
MRKMSFVRFAAAAAMLGSVGLAVALPGSVAGAKKGPVTGSCSLLLGNSTAQLLTGCTGGSSTPQGVSVPNSNDTGATITFLNKKDVTETFTYSGGNNASCPANSYGNSSASTTSILQEVENATVTGGNAKFTAEAVPSSAVCVYLDGDGTILVDGSSGINL